MDDTEQIQKIRDEIKAIRANSSFLKVRLKNYEEFILALDSAEFFLEQFKIEDANSELDIAIEEMRKI